jgi:hypothetical protein
VEMASLKKAISSQPSAVREKRVVGRRSLVDGEEQVPQPRFAHVRNDRKKDKTSNRKNTRRH